MKRALILGGSGGLSGTLAEMAQKYYDEIWVLTRGNRKVEDKKYIHLRADRNDSEKFQKVFLEAGIAWDAVFDCICMNEAHARQDLEVIGRITNRLVVISTDSVYASEDKKILQNEQGTFVNEIKSDTVIPQYARNKRKMEMVFEEYFKKQELEEKKLQITLFRPGHIFGPRFLFGCFPMASRQEKLLETINEEGKIWLVGGGHYLIHPIYAGDLARVMLDCVNNEKTYQEIFCIGGPEIVENRKYYEVLGEILRVPLEIQEIPLTGFLEKYPDYYGNLCHRAYDLTKLRETGIRMPDTTLRNGLENQWEYWK